MENPIFNSLVAALATELGSPKEHESGTGRRFTSAKKGKATVYHSGIAPGNQAEVAFDVASMAKRLDVSESEFRGRLATLRQQTGREVEPNTQHNWPRVGVASPEHVELLLAEIRTRR